MIIVIIEGYIQGQKTSNSIGGASNIYTRYLFRTEIQVTIIIFPSTSKERFQIWKTVCY